MARRVLKQALSGKGGAVNPIVLAELCVGNSHSHTVPERLGKMGIHMLDLKAEVAPACAAAYRQYLGSRRKGGPSSPKKTPLPDFFIGAHALLLGLRLATADADRYRIYFPALKLLVPA
ncbi:MAG: hypothetical protein PHD76_03085 [Methylacidiphilales bacterium]|nr:hypothetical protein [Candidatus Methylacidiphilales bacterium]